MNKPLISLCAGLLLMGPASSWSSEPSLVTVIAAVDARQGPGAYYPVVMRLLPGLTVESLEKSGGWNLTGINLQKGWVPIRALNIAAGVSARQDGSLLIKLKKGFGDDKPIAGVIPAAQITSAVRGFAAAYLARHGVKSGTDTSFLQTMAFTPEEYNAFVAQRFAKRERGRLMNQTPLGGNAPPADQDADRLGAAIAGQVAQGGLIRNPQLERYLGMVATLVAESSHAIDLPMRAFILDTREAVGFVTPDGTLFISAGALSLMKSEAEFAFFAGHEIAHVAMQHGLKRLQADPTRAATESAMTEMESALDWEHRASDKYVRAAGELDALADEVHEYYLSESNDADELEADRWGLVYMKRAGYAPDAARDLMKNFAAANVAKQDEELGSRLFWRGTRMEKRLDQVAGLLKGKPASRRGLEPFSAEFAAQLKGLPEPK